MTPERTAAALQLREQQSLDHTARVLGVSKSSVKRAFDKANQLDAR